jgi:hypothetical protein
MPPARRGSWPNHRRTSNLMDDSGGRKKRDQHSEVTRLPTRSGPGGIRLLDRERLTRDESPPATFESERTPAGQGLSRSNARRRAPRAAGGARAGRGAGASVGRPRWRSIRCTTAASSITAISRNRPPHREHARTSNPNVRCISRAHSEFEPSELAATGSVSAEDGTAGADGRSVTSPETAAVVTGSPGCGSRERHAECAASTPYYKPD